MALRSKRFFLCKDADSYAHLTVPKDKYDKAFCLKMTDCDSVPIRWYFYPSKRGLAKLTKFKSLIDELHAELTKIVNGL